MIVKKELMDRVKDYFDLNIYETKVWLALLGRGIASAGEIAEISRVPRSRTYDVLESLEKKGFAIVKLGKPVQYIGVKPKIILEKLKNNAKKEALERMQTLANISDTEEFIQLESIYNNGINPVKREDFSASLKGRSNISNYLKDILQNAKEEVIICTDAQDMNSKTKLFEQTFENLKKANIKIKVALSGNKELIEKMGKKFNMKISHIEIDAKFFIIDKEQVLFYVSKNEKEDLAIWLNSPFFSQAFSAFFEMAMN